jgi:sugar/nucleoside kinase (ribokinase family)
MNKTTKITCVTSGLIALDVVSLLSKYSPDNSAFLQTGGSCGNVTAIVAAVGHCVIPVARLGRDMASRLVFDELSDLGVDTKYLTKSANDPIPVIFQYLKNDGSGGHRFDLRHPLNRKYLPSYKAVTKGSIEGLFPSLPRAHVFYIDRITPGTIQLAVMLKGRGALVFVEPQRASEKELQRIAPYVDVIKFSEGRLDSLLNVDFLERTVTIIETVGSAGVRFQCAKGKISKKWIMVPAIQGIRAVDTAGAGDWMSASLICRTLPALVKRDAHAIQEGLKVACAWSLLAVLFPGARGAMRHLSMELVQDLALSLSRSESTKERLAQLASLQPMKSLNLRSILATLGL